MRSKHVALAVFSIVAASVATSAFAAWDNIGTRRASDRMEIDTITVSGHRAYRRVKVCVYRHPVHFRDMDIVFDNGGHQDVSIAARIAPGDCTRVIDLDGGARDIRSIRFVYEEDSIRRRRATVRVYAD